MFKIIQILLLTGLFLLDVQATAQQIPELKKGLHRERVMIHFPADTTGKSDRLQSESIYNTSGHLLMIFYPNDSAETGMDTMKYAYDRSGRLISEMVVQYGQVTLRKNYTYNKSGISVTTDSRGVDQIFETYDKSGHLLSKRIVSGKCEWHTINTYDAAGRLLTRSDSQNEAAAAISGYGNYKLSITYYLDGGSQQTQYSDLPGGTHYTQITLYNAKSETIKQVLMTYDHDRKLISRYVFDSLVYSNDKNGLLATFYTNYLSDTHFVRVKGKQFYLVTGKQYFDANNKLTREEQYSSSTYYTVSQGYYLSTRVTWRKEYKYDDSGRLKMVAEFSTTMPYDTVPYRTALYDYDVEGRVVRESYNDRYDTWTYNKAGLIVEHLLFDSSGLINAERFTYDKNGNITRHYYIMYEQPVEEIYEREYY